MRIVVTGKSGQVDTSLKVLAERLDDIELVQIGLPEADLSRPATLEPLVTAARPDIIISSAAYTAVDKAESEPELAQVVNGDGPGALARIAAQLDVPILHMSTDYVFAGDKDGYYTEDDPPSPISVYGRTKLSGETQVRAATPNHIILRTAWVYSPYGANFVKTMIRLGATHEEIKVVSDQNGRPTYAPEIARALIHIARHVVTDPNPELRGVFNLTGQGETSWAGFAEAIFERLKQWNGKSVRVQPIPSSQYPTPARRPANSRLSGEKLLNIYGLKLDPWRVSLDVCLRHLSDCADSEG